MFVVVLRVRRILRVVRSMNSLVALQAQSGSTESGTGEALELRFCDVSRTCSVASFVGCHEITKPPLEFGTLSRFRSTYLIKKAAVRT